MSHFEQTEGSHDNLGKSNTEYIPIDEIADPAGLTPDQIIMQKEDSAEDQTEDVEHVVDIDDFDDEPSNWESDVRSGKYDELKIEKTRPVVEIHPTHTQTRGNVAEIEDIKGSEQMEKYWDIPNQKIDNAKPKRPQDDRDSIRFDEAV